MMDDRRSSTETKLNEKSGEQGGVSPFSVVKGLTPSSLLVIILLAPIAKSDSRHCPKKKGSRCWQETLDRVWDAR